jgi:hypothetical protein
MATFKPDGFLQQLQADPQQSVKIIIRTKTDPKAHTDRVAAMGLTVTHTTSLVKSIAANGPASAVMALASEDWIESIEPDQEVRTM